MEYKIAMIIFTVFAVGLGFFFGYNVGMIVGIRKERKRKKRLLGYHDVEEFYPEEE